MIKVTDLAFGRLRSPDLDVAEEFLTDFGMVRTERTKTALYMRGSDTDHHLHVTELGDPELVGMAFWAASEDDLKTLAKADGASPVEEVDEPGGGKRVRLTDPNGYQIEVIHGVEPLAPLEVRHVTYNSGDERYNRTGVMQRVPQTPAHIKRSAHAVIKTADLAATQAWYSKHLGLAPTDHIYVDEKSNLLGTFNHIDAGEEFVDHHVFLAVQSDGPAFNHLSYEAADFDDVQMGHDYLIRTGKYKHAWGIGRHVLGSQIFDYWRDPWGRIHEFWTDTDMVNNQHEPGLYAPEEALVNQWGPDFPESFLDDPSKHAIA